MFNTVYSVRLACGLLEPSQCYIIILRGPAWKCKKAKKQLSSYCSNKETVTSLQNSAKCTLFAFTYLILTLFSPTSMASSIPLKQPLCYSPVRVGNKNISIDRNFILYEMSKDQEIIFFLTFLVGVSLRSEIQKQTEQSEILDTDFAFH